MNHSGVTGTTVTRVVESRDRKANGPPRTHQGTAMPVLSHFRISKYKTRVSGPPGAVYGLTHDSSNVLLLNQRTFACPRPPRPDIRVRTVPRRGPTS
nr:hypothetical protein GCM10025730_36600 [Promicromonospora thailandica]